MSGAVVQTFTKDELRRIFGHLSRLLPPGPRPLANAEEVDEVNGLLERTRVLIATASGAIERGAKVLEWRIARQLAPTMNEWGFMKTWQRAKVRVALDAEILKLKTAWPDADLVVSRRQRWVRVTRFTVSTGTVDDAAADAIGGKMPVDTLVRANVLAGDTPSLAVREAFIRQTKRGNTHLLVEVFEIAPEQLADPGPVDGPAPTFVPPRSKLAKAILGAG